MWISNFRGKLNMKQYEFVVASKFIELLQSEYGFMYEYTQVNKYCVNVKKDGSLFKDNLALKCVNRQHKPL